MGYYSNTIGANAGVGGEWSYSETIGTYLALDSTGIIRVRLSSVLQRGIKGIALLYGSLYADPAMGATPVTLTGVYYSTTSIAGPWTAATVLSTDDEYSFPLHGSQFGEAYVVPAEVEAAATQVWFYITVQYGAITTGDYYGPCAWIPDSNVYITPDLGWASWDQMLDPAQNELALSISSRDLEDTTQSYNGYIGRNHRALDVHGYTYAIPLSTMLKMVGGWNQYIFQWKSDTIEDPPLTFQLLLDPAPVQ